MNEIMNFKPKFIEKYKKLLGEEINSFLEVSSKLLTKSIRINTLKISKKEFLERMDWQFKQMSWYEYGFWVLNETALGNTIEHSLGYYYIQEAASMIPPLILNPKKHEIILDLCASPGSKTTQIAQMMKNTGIIIANDIRKRTKPLVANLQRCGVYNTIVTNMDGRRFWKVEQKFDKVLLDAPCSGTGAIRKNWEIAKMWSENSIRSLSRLQKTLILSAFDCLKEKGILVYSTCSLEPEENEEVINYLLERRKNAKIKKINLKGLKSRPGLTFWNKKEYFKEIKNCIRIYPQDNDTEGFFIAKIEKT